MVGWREGALKQGSEWSDENKQKQVKQKCVLKEAKYIEMFEDEFDFKKTKNKK